MTGRSNSFGTIVKARREEVGLSQSGLARALGVQQSTISAWEHGKAAPVLPTMVRLAQHLRLDLEALVLAAHDGTAA